MAQRGEAFDPLAIGDLRSFRLSTARLGDPMGFLPSMCDDSFRMGNRIVLHGLGARVSVGDELIGLRLCASQDGDRFTRDPLGASRPGVGVVLAVVVA